MSVAHILKHKGRDVFTVTSGDSVKTVVDLLAQKRIGAIVVSHSDGQIDGIVSERDVVRCLAEHGASALEKPVSAIMTVKIRTSRQSDSEMELMTMMTQNRIRHLPVVEKGKLSGMISIGDVVKFRIQAYEREAEEMKADIAGAA